MYPKITPLKAHLNEREEADSADGLEVGLCVEIDPKAPCSISIRAKGQVISCNLVTNTTPGGQANSTQTGLSEKEKKHVIVGE